MNLISIIIPIYNGEKYIEGCLNSILNQTFNNYEVVIVNDGSTDNTLKIIENYRESFERIIIKTIKNSGPGVARNIGIELANGDLICFVDSDDYVSEYMLEDLYSVYKLNYYDVVVGEVITSSNKERTHFIRKNNVFEIDGLSTAEQMFKSLNQCFNFTHGKLYRKKFLLDNNIYFDNISFGEDILFNLKVYLNCKFIGGISNQVYCYYQNSNSITNSYDSNRNKKLELLLDKLEEYIEKKDSMSRNSLYIYIINSYIGLIVNEMKSNKSFKEINKSLKQVDISIKYRKNILQCKCNNIKQEIIKLGVRFYLLKFIYLSYYIFVTFRRKYESKS